MAAQQDHALRLLKVSDRPIRVINEAFSPSQGTGEQTFAPVERTLIAHDIQRRQYEPQRVGDSSVTPGLSQRAHHSHVRRQLSTVTVVQDCAVIHTVLFCSREFTGCVLPISIFFFLRTCNPARRYGYSFSYSPNEKNQMRAARQLLGNATRIHGAQRRGASASYSLMLRAGWCPGKRLGWMNHARPVAQATPGQALHMIQATMRQTEP